MIRNFKFKIAAGIILLQFVATSRAEAWGKRGHSIVCQSAAYLAAREPKGEFLKMTSFDLGYYCNVPDLVWKQPANYESEWFNHFMDMEIFDHELKGAAAEGAFELDRPTFNAKFPQINNAAGRSWWRIREMMARLDHIGSELKKPNLTIHQRHEMQTEWLVTAGVMGHYVGDLSQPLHLTENYDGQLSGQKGIHLFFEYDVVDELFHALGNLESEVMKAADEKWIREKKTVGKKSVLELLQWLSASSSRALPLLLATDKKVGRKDLTKAASAYHAMIVERMAEGAVALAELYRRELGWEFNAVHFKNFEPAPEFMVPPKAGVPASTTSPVPTN